MFFELQMPGTILGYITKKASEETGIPEGIPVIATANDKAVEALGAGLIDHDTCLISLGTYIASMVLGSENTDDGKSYFTNFADIPNEYLYESSVPNRYGKKPKNRSNSVPMTPTVKTIGSKCTSLRLSGYFL